VRYAALIAALVPAASIAIMNATAQDLENAVPSPCDFATSGGFVWTDDGRKANFGVHGGCKNGSFWGHVNYMDHGSGYHVDSLEVTGYLTPYPGSNVREICGLARTNADEPQPVWFRVRLVDNEALGTPDEFGIRLSNGYVVTTRSLNAGGPGGGSVQLHEPNPSTTAPYPAPDELAMCNGLPSPSAQGGVD
jgi:hypothetical protein